MAGLGVPGCRTARQAHQGGGARSVVEVIEEGLQPSVVLVVFNDKASVESSLSVSVNSGVQDKFEVALACDFRFQGASLEGHIGHGWNAVVREGSQGGA